jgi:hypothetical protein
LKSPSTIAAASHHAGPSWFRHAETRVKGTGMGYRNFLPAEIGHLAVAATGKHKRRHACRLRVVPLSLS